MGTGRREYTGNRHKTTHCFHEQENVLSFKVRRAHISIAVARYQFQESVNSKDHILVLALLHNSFHEVFLGLGRNLRSLKQLWYVSIHTLKVFIKQLKQ